MQSCIWHVRSGMAHLLVGQEAQLLVPEVEEVLQQEKPSQEQEGWLVLVGAGEEEVTPSAAAVAAWVELEEEEEEEQLQLREEKEPHSLVLAQEEHQTVPGAWNLGGQGEPQGWGQQQEQVPWR